MLLTKIVATLGPVSRDEANIRRLIEAGANVFRFNYSHAEYDELKVAYKTVRRVSQELGKPVGILSDLQGPKFRVGFFEEGEKIQLTQGEEVKFIYSLEKGNQTTLACNVKELVSSLIPGNAILLDDGKIELKVLRRESPECVVCQVMNSGPLKERKGVNVPDISIPVPAMTPKDYEDCLFALEQGTDFIALSFVQRAEDVKELRRFLAEKGIDRKNSPKIVCKIEKPQALTAIDEILEETDVIMVARGDLGVELRPEFVPGAQKRLIRRANELGKPVITATQMLESMISDPVPTRAEVSDVANAIFDGTDAIMLSAETASGKYPVPAVQMMTRIGVEAEREIATLRPDAQFSQALMTVQHTAAVAPISFPQSIAQSAVATAIRCQAKAIVVLSVSGAMANRISKCKPNVPIIAITPNEAVTRHLNVCFGVVPLQFGHFDSSDETLRNVETILAERGIVAKGETIVFCAGETHLLGMTNSMHVYQIGARPHAVAEVAAASRQPAAAL
jgi:pyruvate kinase